MCGIRSPGHQRDPHDRDPRDARGDPAPVIGARRPSRWIDRRRRRRVRASRDRPGERLVIDQHPQSLGGFGPHETIEAEVERSQLGIVVVSRAIDASPVADDRPVGSLDEGSEPDGRSRDRRIGGEVAIAAMRVRAPLRGRMVGVVEALPKRWRTPGDHGSEKVGAGKNDAGQRRW